MPRRTAPRSRSRLPWRSSCSHCRARPRGSSPTAREPDEQHLRQAAGVRDARGRPRAPGRAPGHRRRERGNRAAGTSGYDASVDYVVDTLEAAGWSVEIDLFDFTVAQPIQQLTPAPRHARGGRRDRQRPGDGHRPGRPDRHQPDPPREHERVPGDVHRGRGRCAAGWTRAASTTSPASRRRRDRTDPAGWLQLRAQGRQRAGAVRTR